MTTILYGKDMLKMEDVKMTLQSNEKKDKPTESEGLVVKSSSKIEDARIIEVIRRLMVNLLPNQEDEMTIVITVRKI